VCGQRKGLRRNRFRFVFKLSVSDSISADEILVIFSSLTCHRVVHVTVPVRAISMSFINALGFNSLIGMI